MHIELQINENRVEFFLEYLNSLKDGIIEKMEIKKQPSFMLSSVDEVKKRVELAEKNANYTEHDDFWQEMGVK